MVQSSEDMIRVMTYNVRYFAHGLKGAASTPAGVQSITDQLSRTPVLPHVICLQEVESRSLRSRLSLPQNDDHIQIQVLLQRLNDSLALQQRTHRYGSFYFPAHTYELRGTAVYTTGLAILVRSDVDIDAHNAGEPHDITYVRTAWLSGVKQTRICAHMRLRIDDKSLDIFNTHLSLPAFISKRQLQPGYRMGYGINQEREVESLAQFIDEKKKSGHYLLMGDFNALPASPVYHRIMKELNLRDDFPELMGQSPIELRNTWPTAGFMHLRMRLDHIFLGPDLESVDYEGTHPFGAKGPWHGLSDHVPIFCRFAMR